MDSHQLKGTPILRCTQELLNEVNYLHKEHKGKEWSGHLAYNIASGDIDDPNNMVMEAKGMFLMDLGTSGSTDFEMDAEDSIALLDYFPEIEEGEIRLGLIHSHHSMRAYFSKTDEEEIEDNIEDHNAYLSLIVNYAGDYACRLYWPVKVKEHTKSNVSFETVKGSDINEEMTSENEKIVMYYYECIPILPIETNVSDKFEQRYEEVDSRPRYSSTSYGTGTYGNSGYGYSNKNYGQGSRGYNNRTKRLNSSSSKSTSKKKPTSYFNNKEIGVFLSKLLSENPDSAVTSPFQVLGGLKSNPTPTPEDFFNVIDECMLRTFGLQSPKQIGFAMQMILIEESFDYLTARDRGNKPLVDLYDRAKVASEALKQVLDYNEGEIINEELADG